jgi:hypothetical protein
MFEQSDFNQILVIGILEKKLLVDPLEIEMNELDSL